MCFTDAFEAAGRLKRGKVFLRKICEWCGVDSNVVKRIAVDGVNSNMQSAIGSGIIENNV